MKALKAIGMKVLQVLWLLVQAVWFVVWVACGLVLYLVALFAGAFWGAWAWLAPGPRSRKQALGLPPYWTPGNR